MHLPLLVIPFCAVLPMNITFRYAGFALIATVANIGSQDLSIRVYFGAYAVTLSVMFGTAVGLLVKYVLDKKFIFRYQPQNLTHDALTLSLYTLTGIFTTLVFWGFEFGFAALFEAKELRYLGGVIGLAIGYTMKYRLDQRFVFTWRKA